MDRTVKNAKDIVTNEVIYFVGHADATYLNDGTTVENKLQTIENNITNAVRIMQFTVDDDMFLYMDTVGTYNPSGLIFNVDDYGNLILTNTYEQ